MTPQPPARLARAAVFTAVCVALTMLAHELASRTPVPPAATALGAALVLGIAWVLAGHPRSPVTILAGLLGGQFGMHVLFAIQQSGPAHLHAQERLAPVPAGSGAGMTSVHLAVAAASAWWLWQGERLAWRLARRLRALAALSLVWPRHGGETVPPAARGWPPPAASRARPRTVLLRHCLVLRGPPSGSPLLPAR